MTMCAEEMVSERKHKGDLLHGPFCETSKKEMLEKAVCTQRFWELVGVTNGAERNCIACVCFAGEWFHDDSHDLALSFSYQLK